MKILNYILKMFTLLIENKEKEKDKEISIKKVFYRLFILFLLLLIIYRSCSIKLEKIEIEKNYKYFFCFSSIGKLENNYVKELVDYYKNIGVDKFILGDNNDKDSERLSDVLQKEIDEGLVDILDFTGRRKHQTDFFKDSYEMYKNKCRWISFYDFDEFLELKEGNTVQSYFTEEKFKNCDVILINWLVFNDNNLVKYEDKPVTERFTKALYKSRDNVFVKSIIKGNIRHSPWDTDQTSHRPNHHLKTCLYNGQRAKTFNDVLKPPRIDEIYLKHYVTKTVEEYILKKYKRGYTSRFIDENLWVDNFFGFNKVTKEKVEFIEKTLNMTFPKYHYIFDK
jgi:hypothetical protein